MHIFHTVILYPCNFSTNTLRGNFLTNTLRVHAVLSIPYLDLSVMLACIARSLAGGIYAPPVRVVSASTSSSFVFLGALGFFSPSPVAPSSALQNQIIAE